MRTTLVHALQRWNKRENNLYMVHVFLSLFTQKKIKFFCLFRREFFESF